MGLVTREGACCDGAGAGPLPRLDLACSGFVRQHGESTQRQYALTDDAERLGGVPRVLVIEADLGPSGRGGSALTGLMRCARSAGHAGSRRTWDGGALSDHYWAVASQNRFTRGDPRQRARMDLNARLADPRPPARPSGGRTVTPQSI